MKSNSIARHQLQLLDIYKDEGISGATYDEEDLTIDRVELQNMLLDLHWREVKNIIVLNTSRLWRSDMVKILIHRELKKHHVDVSCLWVLLPQRRKSVTGPSEQTCTIRRVFHLRHEHPHWPLSQIAERLNLEGYQTSQGKPFSKVQVKRILDCEAFYKGMYSYGQILVMGKHEPIL